MNNQWGRGGSGSTGRGGSGGILFATLISLVVGGAAGYGVFRTMDTVDSSGEIAVHQERIRALSSELDSVSGKTAEQTAKVQELTEANGSLRRQVDSLRNSLNASGSQSDTDRLAQDVVTELEAQVKTLGQRVADAEAFRRRAEDEVRQRDRQLTLQTDALADADQQLKRLKAELDDARNAGTAERNAEIETLRKQAAAAQALADEAATIFETEISNLKADIEAKDSRIAKSALELETTSAEMTERDAQIAALETRIRTLSDQIATLEKNATKALPTKIDDTEATAGETTKPASENTPRDRVSVELALLSAPGLGLLSAEQRTTLQDALVAGECVTNALGAVFQRVPVLALRNLMRDLESDC
jgi:chromosome segregation ATPase